MRAALQSKAEADVLPNTKAGRLAALNGSLRHAVVDDFLTFKVKRWRAAAPAILQAIQQHFPAKQAVIVRSSAIDEDKRGGRLAGALHSERVNAGVTDPKLAQSIHTVVASFARNGRQPDAGDQVIVQRLVENVVMSGVLITQDVWHHPAYYLINYDDASGLTFHVTAGRGGRSLRIFRDTPDEAIPSCWRKLIAATRELERTFPNESLMVEFAVDETATVHIFQVRDLERAPRALERSRVEDAAEHLQRLQTRLPRLPQNARGVVGATTLFSDMADWNPAEMLGPRPAPLDMSLYRYLITERGWNEGRVSLGYTDVSPAELMVTLGDKPYIDVRVSLNSLTPAVVARPTRAALIDWGLEHLRSSPELHDKIEFHCAFSHFDLDVKERLQRLTGGVLSRRETRGLHATLLSFTNGLLKSAPEMLARDATQLNELRKNPRPLARTSTPIGDLRAAIELLDRCRRAEVVIFSRVARLAFVALAVLESLRNSGAISEQFYERFLRDQRTVADEVRVACDNLSRGALPRADFLREFGHLRPMTYDITSTRYDAMPASTWKKVYPYEAASSKFAPRSHELRRLTRALMGSGMTVEAAGVLSFISTAIKLRELAKFVFTRDLSNALESLARCGESIGLSREQIAAVPLNEVSRAVRAGRVDRRQAAGWSEHCLRVAENRRQLGAIALPPLVGPSMDLRVVDYPESSPNFVTHKKVRGPRVVLDRASSSRITGGLILLESADPGFDWIFQHRPLGLITKYGGAGSHMTIRCAAFGIPAAIGCGEVVFAALQSANVIELDCAHGTVVPVF